MYFSDDESEAAYKWVECNTIVKHFGDCFCQPPGHRFVWAPQSKCSFQVQVQLFGSRQDQPSVAPLFLPYAVHPTSFKELKQLALETHKPASGFRFCSVDWPPQMTAAFRS